MVKAFRQFIGSNAMMAYLVMMAPRLVELRRALKPTGSIYLQLRPDRSHYLKLLMDAVFGAANFRNEIIWRRANAHNDPKRFGRISDTLLYYGKSESVTWILSIPPTGKNTMILIFPKTRTDATSEPVPLDAPRHGEGSPGLLYEWHGKLPAPTRTWAVAARDYGEV